MFGRINLHVASTKNVLLKDFLCSRCFKPLLVHYTYMATAKFTK